MDSYVTRHVASRSDRSRYDWLHGPEARTKFKPSRVPLLFRWCHLFLPLLWRRSLTCNMSPFFIFDFYFIYFLIHFFIIIIIIIIIYYMLWSNSYTDICQGNKNGQQRKSIFLIRLHINVKWSKAISSYFLEIKTQMHLATLNVKGGHVTFWCIHGY